MWRNFLSTSSVRLSKSKHDSFIVSQRLLTSCPSSFESFRWKVLAHFPLLTVLSFSPNPERRRQQVEETFQDQKPFDLPTSNHDRNPSEPALKIGAYGQPHGPAIVKSTIASDGRSVRTQTTGATALSCSDKSLSQPKAKVRALLGAAEHSDGLSSTSL